MWRGLAVSTGSLAGALSFTAVVYAGDDKPKSEGNQVEKKLCKARELPLYGEPTPACVECVPHEVTGFERSVSIVRKLVWSITGSFSSTASSAVDTYDIGKAHTLDLVSYLKDDPGALPRAAFITVSGLGGVVAGYKGGFFRKFFYSSGAMLTASAICYPPQAIDLGKVGWQNVRSKASGFMAAPKPSPPNPIAEKIVSEVDKNLDKLKAEPEEEVKDPNEDHGMSTSEDKDMYTTRGN